jgi:hypothetical protein
VQEALIRPLIREVAWVEEVTGAIIDIKNKTCRDNKESMNMPEIRKSMVVGMEDTMNMLNINLDKDMFKTIVMT